MFLGKKDEDNNVKKYELLRQLVKPECLQCKTYFYAVIGSKIQSVSSINNAAPSDMQ
jgi:hypothetical protein